MSQRDTMPSVLGRLSVTNKKITPSNNKMDPEMQGTSLAAVFFPSVFAWNFFFFALTHQALKLDSLRALGAVHTAHPSTCGE